MPLSLSPLSPVQGIHPKTLTGFLHAPTMFLPLSPLFLVQGIHPKTLTGFLHAPTMFLPLSPLFLVQGIHPKTLTCLPNASAPVIASTCLFAFPIGLLLSHRVFLLACPPLSGTGAIALPALLLHVFVNSFVVHVQKLCDLTLTSLTGWALRPGLTQAASNKKKFDEI